MRVFLFQNGTSDETVRTNSHFLKISVTKISLLVPCLNEDKLYVWLTPLLDAQTRSSSLKFFLFYSLFFLTGTRIL